VTQPSRLAIIGAGNIGMAIANGLTQSQQFKPEQITLTRRHIQSLEKYKEQGFQVLQDNNTAVKNSEVILVAVEPQQLDNLLTEISPSLEPNKHILISVVTGATINQILNRIGKKVVVVRAMPNTAIAIRESMTCLTSGKENGQAIEVAKSIFDCVGKTLVIDEDRMSSATALAACGIAFFLRAIRAASQGGIEIGFHANNALLMAAQTAKGAASLLVTMDTHPEHEIDRVTTPRGCTIAGLNQMEHEGFSSAMIKGIVTSAKKADELYKSSKE
jgi:pyrroline-5-carboxylate reductase